MDAKQSKHLAKYCSQTWANAQTSRRDTLGLASQRFASRTAVCHNTRHFSALFRAPWPKRGRACSMRRLDRFSTRCKREPARMPWQRTCTRSWTCGAMQSLCHFIGVVPTTPCLAHLSSRLSRLPRWNWSPSRGFCVDSYCWCDSEGNCRDSAQGEGCERGDPLAPALFALGQHRALLQAASALYASDSLSACSRSWMTCMS